MAALVQSYPQQSGTVTMLQTRPTSASGIMSTSQSQSNQQYGHVGSQQRNSIHGVSGPVMYRGSSTPVQPYAFTSTPSLNQSAQWQQFRTFRTTSTPVVPAAQTFEYGQAAAARPRYATSASMTNLPSTVSTGLQLGAGSRDDSVIPMQGARRGSTTPRPQSAYLAGAPPQPSLAPAAPIRASPERYRRPAPRASDGSTTSSSGSSHQSYSLGSAQPSGSGMAAVSHIYNARTTPEQNNNMLRPHPSLLNRPNSFVGSMPGLAADDLQLYRGQSQEELKRFRRRSLPALDSAEFTKSLAIPPLDVKQPDESSRREQLAVPNSADKDKRPAARGHNLGADKGNTSTSHTRTGSSDSRSSHRSTGSSSRPSSSANRSTNVSAPTGNPALLSSPADQNGNNQDYPRLVNIPPRSSSTDAANTKRATNPSPLSKPVTMATEAEKSQSVDSASAAAVTSPKTTPASPRIDSPAARQLAAINEKGARPRSKTSRLRRAFSFGSAAEFRKGANDNDIPENAQVNSPAKLHKEPTADDVYNAEQARIAQQQEAAGIGNNIYSGGKIFSASTDNISVSSTASSASIMIRKMGRGMKKGTRSLVGLFRPKSIIGAPDADLRLPTPEVTQATVTMVTVEAERERVNVNPDPKTQPGGGTGYPRLERNSIDASKAPSTQSERLGSSGTDNSAARKSIVGGEKERAEVLAAVRKGILKKSSPSSSPSPRPSDSRAPGFEVPSVPSVADSPNSSAPSTPNDEQQGHKRAETVAIGSEDYFLSALRLRQDTKSAPGTPQGGSMKRNTTFNPRIMCFETWPSQEYDRRGEVATCNRLTPMLAQQIKEELNSFKMEMEVHENSKIYTHFF
ncbi:hypothetical protein QBC46DRAFT_54129 [Diplogelasinospora grovesii]|uniref:Protein BNI4 n=1 Tax=Diplogelasinospora grovesii TaxID=303347 RepID=A0AAN6ND57_9PEZI|nr:hypothetical protein QBC46DRAFT_54129 [Diplogelasinospora grovesii]